jgi:hypothetical protein
LIANDVYQQKFYLPINLLQPGEKKYLASPSFPACVITSAAKEGRAIRSKSACRTCKRTSGFPLLSLAGKEQVYNKSVVHLVVITNQHLIVLIDRTNNG